MAPPTAKSCSSLPPIFRCSCCDPAEMRSGDKAVSLSLFLSESDALGLLDGLKGVALFSSGYLGGSIPPVSFHRIRGMYTLCSSEVHKHGQLCRDINVCLQLNPDSDTDGNFYLQPCRPCSGRYPELKRRPAVCVTSKSTTKGSSFVLSGAN